MICVRLLRDRHERLKTRGSRMVDPGRVRVSRPTVWAGRLDITMATRKKHAPEQFVRKLATADLMLDEGKDVADVCRELQIPSRLTTGGVTSSAG